MNRVISVAMAVLMSVTFAMAADVTGTWRGTISDERKTEPALVILDQSGTAIKETVGGNEDNRFALENGNLQGDVITFEVKAPNGNLMVFNLKLNADEISGAVEARRDGQTVRRGRITLKRQ